MTDACTNCDTLRMNALPVLVAAARERLTVGFRRVPLDSISMNRAGTSAH